MQEAAKPSLVDRALAVAVLICVGLLLLKLAVGFVVGTVITIFWIFVAVFVVAALVWAIRHI
jgi:hypothetical protein